MYPSDENVWLKNIITGEFTKYEQNGYKIRFKGLTKRRVILSLTLLPIGLLTVDLGFGVILLIIYLVIMLKNSKLGYIKSLVRKNPDREITQIIREELSL